MAQCLPAQATYGRCDIISVSATQVHNIDLLLAGNPQDFINKCVRTMCICVCMCVYD